jgi:predicted transcriptional regulator
MGMSFGRSLGEWPDRDPATKSADAIDYRPKDHHMPLDKRKGAIVQHLRENPRDFQPEIAEKLSIPLHSVQKILGELKADGTLKREKESPKGKFVYRVMK